VQAFDLNGWRIGVLICEDFWHPLLTYLHALQGVHALLVMAAAPGRGAWTGGEAGAFFASSDSWERIARTYAQLYGIYVVICNRCGVEGGVTFAGESIAVAPDASVLARAGTGEALLTVELQAEAVRTARTPYAHIRDEDAALAVREIQRIAAAR
ncbi:MAG TPA: nitrilase-related carbon-nitrogen hydrolase, partial [Longimicrobiales bacterium]